MLDKTVLIEKNPAQLFRSIGRKLPKAGWPVGNYFGSVYLLRDGKVISTEKTKIFSGIAQLFFGKLQLNSAVFARALQACQRC